MQTIKRERAPREAARKVEMAETRKGLFRRNIELEVEEAGEGLLLVRGRLTDTRAGKAGGDEDREGKPQQGHRDREGGTGHVVHDMEVTALVEVGSGLIHNIRGAMHHVPYPQCREALKALGRLAGERIAPGFSSLVREVVWSREGCVHLAVLVTEIGHVSVQGMGAWASRRVDWMQIPREQLLMGLEALQLPDSCYTWRRDGELMARILGGEERPGEDVS